MFPSVRDVLQSWKEPFSLKNRYKFSNTLASRSWRTGSEQLYFLNSSFIFWTTLRNSRNETKKGGHNPCGFGSIRQRSLLFFMDFWLCTMRRYVVFFFFFIFNFFRFFASAAFSSASPVVSGFILFTKHQTYFLFRWWFLQRLCDSFMTSLRMICYLGIPKWNQPTASFTS